MGAVGFLDMDGLVLALGDYLVVAVSTDEFNRIKGKVCVYPYEHRSEIVKAIRYVDEVIPEECWEQKIRDVKKHHIDIFVMGSDWRGKFDFLSEWCKVVYLERTPDISSTEIRQNVKNGS